TKMPAQFGSMDSVRPSSTPSGIRSPSVSASPGWVLRPPAYTFVYSSWSLSPSQSESMFAFSGLLGSVSTGSGGTYSSQSRSSSSPGSGSPLSPPSSPESRPASSPASGRSLPPPQSPQPPKATAKSESRSRKALMDDML